MFGLSSGMTFLMFVFWPSALVAAALYGVFGFRGVEKDDDL